MAKISEMAGRKDAGYTRLFGDERLGHLISQTHAAVIRGGTELQRMLNSALSPDAITTIDAIAQGEICQNVEIIINPEKPRAGETRAIVSDYAIFFHLKKHFIVVELKDGDMFDTQKSPAIKKNLQRIVEFITSRTGYSGAFYVCSFNSNDKQLIAEGFKGVFSNGQIMTGYELCMYLGIDYEEIVEKREEDQKDNKYYFLGQVGKVERDMTPEEYFEQKRKIKAEQLRMYWMQGKGE